MFTFVAMAKIKDISNQKTIAIRPTKDCPSLFSDLDKLRGLEGRASINNVIINILTDELPKRILKAEAAKKARKK